MSQEKHPHPQGSSDSIVVDDHTDQSGTGTVVEILRIPNADAKSSCYIHCIDAGDIGSGHMIDAHMDVEVENAAHASLVVHMEHCNRHCSNERLCSLPLFCWESCCAQEDVSTAIDKNTARKHIVSTKHEWNTRQDTVEP